MCFNSRYEVFENGKSGWVCVENVGDMHVSQKASKQLYKCTHKKHNTTAGQAIDFLPGELCHGHCTDVTSNYAFPFARDTSVFVCFSVRMPSHAGGAPWWSGDLQIKYGDGDV